MPKFTHLTEKKKAPPVCLTEPVWERQHGESHQAHEAFIVYRDLGAMRSVVKAAAYLHKQKSMLERWSVRWRWVDRVRMWDVEQQHAKDQAHLQGIEEMERRHTAIARRLQQKALERLANTNPKELKIHDILAFLQAGMAAERLARGEAEQRTAVSVDAKISVDDLAKRMVADLPKKFRHVLNDEIGGGAPDGEASEDAQDDSDEIELPEGLESQMTEGDE